KRKGAVDRLSDSYRNVKNTQKTVRLTIKTIKQVTQAIRWFANPYFMVFAVILMIIIILSLEASPCGATWCEAGTDEEQTTGQPNQPVPIQGLDLEISGPTAVNNGQSISYQVSISYDAAVAIIPIEDITIFHEIPQNTSFSSSSGIHENQSG